MAFRADRDALRARAEALESEKGDLEKELAQAQRELARHERKDVRDERELEALKEEVDRLRARLGMKTPERPGSKKAKRSRLLAVVAAGALLAGVGAMAFLTHEEKAEGKPAVAVAELPAAPAAAAATAPPPAPAAATTTPLDAARFGALVLHAEGLEEIEAGAGCFVDAELDPRGEVGRLQVRCGDARVYDSTMDGGAEMTAHESAVEEFALPGGAFAYRVRYGDTGTRTGPRPQIQLDTLRQRARVWRDGLDPFELRLRVDDRSAPRPGSALRSYRELGELGRLHQRAVPTSRRGPAPASIDEGCELIGHSDVAGGDNDCRLMLACGEAVLYGAERNGYVHCLPLEPVPGSPPDIADDEGTSDENTDPILHLRTADRTLTLADVRGGERWEVVFRLADDEACRLDGAWSGVTRTAEGERPLGLAPRTSTTSVRTRGGRTTQSASQEGAVVVSALASGEAEVELDCRQGTGELRVGEHIFEGRFGPGFRTFLGRVRGGAPATFALQRSPGEGAAVSAIVDVFTRGGAEVSVSVSEGAQAEGQGAGEPIDPSELDPRLREIIEQMDLSQLSPERREQVRRALEGLD